ncbi:hypothetical protein AURDEDRAFT_124268 [Auricularia subglabra TFB-10046 SS5]|nr:hypothetical protein AURDEDRAFT_124268 [Auricularia subglabra TFB-10046 SS5]
MSTALRIPTPVGGVPNDIDRIPSIVFAVAWGALLPFAVRRITLRKSTVLLIGPCVLLLTNLVMYSLRAAQAFGHIKSTSTGFLIFIQGELASGYCSLMTDSIMLLKAIVDNARVAPIDPEAAESPQAASRKTRYTPLQLAGIALAVLYFAAPGTLAGVQSGFYSSGQETQSSADAIQGMRYASAILALIPLLVMAGITVYSYVSLPRIDKAACRRFIYTVSLCTVIAVYRLVVMSNHVPAIAYTGHGSLTSPAAKTIFYILHSAPEVLAAALMIISSVPTTEVVKRRAGASPSHPMRADRLHPVERPAEYIEMAGSESTAQLYPQQQWAGH